MTDSDRWLLPEGIEEVLPPRAQQVEQLRRDMLDLCRSWGYELVMPPFVEYLESLLTGVGSDLDLQTFKVTDQLNGRMMGVRADITPQVARIEAHSLDREGVVRLCYGGSALRTRSPNMLSSRSPLLLGAELFGSDEQTADVEVIRLMLETLTCAGVQGLHLDLGHVGVYRAIVSATGLAKAQKTALFDILQRKSVAELNVFIAAEVKNPELADQLLALMELHGGEEVLDLAMQRLGTIPEVVTSIETLRKLAASIADSHPDVDIYFDLAELRGYRYHTGVVFAAYADGFGQSIAKGGRYDDIGSVFGRAKPATGFSIDLKNLLQLLPCDAPDVAPIFAPVSEDTNLPGAIRELRNNGEVVVQLLREGEPVPAGARQLVLQDGRWQVR